MKRALMYASVASMIQQFNMDNIRLLIEAGYQVDVACNMEEGSTITNEKIAAMKQDLADMGCNVFHMPIPRKITALKEIFRSVRLTKQLIEDNKYTLIHCHSPIGGVISRIANRISSMYRKNTMIYTAHGFHFFKGGPKSSWLIFYPIEKFLSRWTNVLITINREDFELAQKRLFTKKVLKVPGVGVDTAKYRSCTSDRAKLRSELGVSDADTLILSVGELSDRKNHAVIIRAIHKLSDPHIHYAIVGKGANHKLLKDLSDELQLEKRVHLLGFRSDIPELCKAADLFAFPSKREGLGLAAIEAMAAGLPIITSNINGINDYSVNGKTGFSCDPMDADAFAKSIHQCMTDKEWLSEVKERNVEIAKTYDIEHVNTIMKELYGSVKTPS